MQYIDTPENINTQMRGHLKWQNIDRESGNKIVSFLVIRDFSQTKMLLVLDLYLLISIYST